MKKALKKCNSSISGNVLWLYFSCKLRNRVFSAENKRLAKDNFDFSRYFAIE